MPKFQNNTKGVSRVGHICKVDPNVPNAFLYVANNTSFALGVIAEAVPYRAYAEVITQGEALVYVNDNVRKDDIIRAQKSDNITTGSCKVVKTGDAPYLKVGTALQAGRGLIKVSLKWEYIATESTGNFQPLDADLTQLADHRRIGGDTNYTQFEADGTVTFEGDATVWDDLNFDPDSSGGPAVTLPDYVIINDVIHREFTSANNQICGDGQELPHGYKLSSTLYPHIHVFLKNGEGAGATGAAFTFYWELRQTTGTTSGSVVLTATSAALAANPNRVDVFDATGFAGAAELGAQLTVKIARTAGNAGDVIVTTYGVHYEIDMAGSRQITSK